MLRLQLLCLPEPRARAGVAVAGILAVLHCCLDLKATIGGRHPAALFFLATAMRPRMLMTVDEAGALLPVPVRVGQAVDVVAQARPPSCFAVAATPIIPDGMSLGGGQRRCAASPSLPRAALVTGELGKGFRCLFGMLSYCTCPPKWWMSGRASLARACVLPKKECSRMALLGRWPHAASWSSSEMLRLLRWCGGRRGGPRRSRASRRTRRRCC